MIVDVAIDQGGCIETINRATTHSDPTYILHGVVHYAVANIPGAVARTSTIALTNATIEAFGNENHVGRSLHLGRGQELLESELDR